MTGKHLRSLLWAVLMAAALILPTRAAAPTAGVHYTDGWTLVADDSCTLTCTLTGAGTEARAAGYTARCTGLTPGRSYVLLVVKLNRGADPLDLAHIPGAYGVSDATVTYMAQAAADSSGAVSFPGFLPRALPDSVVLLGGGDAVQVVGTILAHPVEVTGAVGYYRETPWSMSLTVLDEAGAAVTQLDTGTDGSFTLSLPQDSYSLVVEGPGYLRYTVPFTVTDHPQPLSISCYSRAGDTDNSGAINPTDLANLIADFGRDVPLYATDLDHSGAVNATDLGLLLANFGRDAQ